MLGEDHGLGRMEILTALEDDRSRDLVLAQEAQVRLSGVTDVPVFLVNKRFFCHWRPVHRQSCQCLRQGDVRCRE